MTQQTNEEFLHAFITHANQDTLRVGEVVELAPGFLVARRVFPGGESAIPMAVYDSRAWMIRKEAQEADVDLERAARNCVFGIVGELDWDYLYPDDEYHHPSDQAPFFERLQRTFESPVGAAWHALPVDVTNQMYTFGLIQPGA